MTAIRDVAKRAGVSTATVSHVINNTHYVTPALRARVLAAMDDLSYQPSEVARSLRMKVTRSVGLIISDIELPFFATIARGVQDTFARQGRSVIVCNTDENAAVEAECLRVLWSKRVDGLIIVPTGQNADLINKMQSTGMLVVLIDRRCPGVDAPHVGVDNRAAACEAVSYLVRQGHRRIGIVAGLSHLSTISERIAGYRDALAAASYGVDEDLIRFTNSRAPEAREATRDLLQIHPPVTAIFTTVSDITMGALQVLQACRDRRFPADVSLLGLDDPDWCSVASPAITAVRQPPYDIGRVAGEMLGTVIAGGQLAEREILLETQLVVRGSVCERG